MYELCRVRLFSVGPPGARYQDVTLDLRGVGDPVEPTGRQADLFAPGLEQAGLPPGRVIHVEAGDDTSVLACMEEGLRHGGLAAVVAEAPRLPMTASRRLHLAARESGTLGIALRRWRRQARQVRERGTPE